MDGPLASNHKKKLIVWKEFGNGTMCGIFWQQLESFKYLLGDLIGCLKKEKLSVLSMAASEPMKCYLKSVPLHSIF